MAKLTLTDLSNLQNDTTATSAINANSALIENAVENTLSRDGTTPNEMGANLDMNSNRIINLPAALNNTEPVRLAEYLANASPLVAGNMPAGGTTGQYLKKLSNADFDTDWVDPAVSEDGVINLNDHYDFVGDGVTDNLPATKEFQKYGNKLGTGLFPKTVTITIASPAVISLTGHRLKPGDAVSFTTTGALPTGITAGTVYYVTQAGLLKDSFCISATTFAIGFDTGFRLIGDQTRINTSGSQSGVHKMTIYGYDWTEFRLLPGLYTSTPNSNLVSNRKRTKMTGYGAILDRFNFGYFLGPYVGLDATYGVYAVINSVNRNSTTVTVTTPSDLNNGTGFYVNQWIVIAQLDLQNTFGVAQSFPPNNQHFEIRQITDINTTTGVITLDEGIRNSYQSWYPEFWAGDASVPTGAGPATIFGLNPTWDQEQIIEGFQWIPSAFQNTLGTCRSQIIRNCIIPGQQGWTPTTQKHLLIDNCIFEIDAAEGTPQFELDKHVENVTLRNCSAPGGSVLCQSTSPNSLEIDGCTFKVLNGTSKNVHVKNSDIGQVLVQPYFGTCDNLLIQNSKIGDLSVSARLDNFPTGAPGASKACLVNNWTFTNGTLKHPIASTTANNWAVPGRAVQVTDYAGVNQSMGLPFEILDVYTSGSDFCINTTLESIPAGPTTTSVVTIDTGTDKVAWAGHGRSNDTVVTFLTTGALPTGLTEGGLYYMVNVGANDFQVATSAGGTPIDFSGSQSGVHTAVAAPLTFIPQPCPRVTVRNSRGCTLIEDMNDAPEAMPLYSYSKRRLVGPFNTNTGFYPPLRVLGKLALLSVNVIRAYTGATNPHTLAITSNGFNTSTLAVSNMTQTIDLRTTGLRTISQSGTTGGVGADVLAAYTGWLAGGNGYVKMTPSAITVETEPSQPIVEIEITTDQGVTLSAVTGRLGTNDGSQSWLVGADTVNIDTGTG